jgi:inhibitor of KinA
VLTFTNYLINNPINEIINIHPAYNSVMISLDPFYRLAKIQEYIKTIIENFDNMDVIGEGSTVEIPVVYGGEYGPDLDKVAQHCDLSVDEVIEKHSNENYLVYFIGFSIGFPYLGGMNSSLATPRLETPRTRVPEGSIGIADTQTGIYPLSSPGGWNLIGQTPRHIFNADNPKESMLKMGDIIRFKSVTAEQFKDSAL